MAITQQETALPVSKGKRWVGDIRATAPGHLLQEFDVPIVQAVVHEFHCIVPCGGCAMGQSCGRRQLSCPERSSARRYKLPPAGHISPVRQLLQATQALVPPTVPSIQKQDGPGTHPTQDQGHLASSTGNSRLQKPSPPPPPAVSSSAPVVAVSRHLWIQLCPISCEPCPCLSAVTVKGGAFSPSSAPSTC